MGASPDKVSGHLWPIPHDSPYGAAQAAQYTRRRGQPTGASVGGCTARTKEGRCGTGREGGVGIRECVLVSVRLFCRDPLTSDTCF